MCTHPCDSVAIFLPNFCKNEFLKCHFCATKWVKIEKYPKLANCSSPRLIDTSTVLVRIFSLIAADVSLLWCQNVSLSSVRRLFYLDLRFYPPLHVICMADFVEGAKARRLMSNEVLYRSPRAPFHIVSVKICLPLVPFPPLSFSLCVFPLPSFLTLLSPVYIWVLRLAPSAVARTRTFSRSRSHLSTRNILLDSKGEFSPSAVKNEGRKYR